MEINYEEVAAFIKACSPETRVYIGSDSTRRKVLGKRVFDCSVVVAVHIDGCHGCKLFAQTTREPDYDSKQDAPILRLLKETERVAEVYNNLKAFLPEKEIEIHLDLNKDSMHGSSCAVKQAVGYVQGMCNVVPLVKPLALAASFGADRICNNKELA